MPCRHAHGPLQPRHEKAKASTPPSLPSRSTSSSTSSAANHADYSLPDGFSNFRLNPSLLARNRATPSTPVVNWISFDLPSHDELACPLTHPSRRSFTVSARKIAATIWDFHQDTPYACRRLPRNREKLAVRHDQLPELDSSPATSCVSHRSHTRSCARNNKAVLCKTTDSKAKAQLTDSSSSSPEVNRRASRRFVKMLNQISDLEDKNTCSIQIVSALNMEINHASEQVEELLHEQKSYNKEVQKLSKGLSDKRIWPREGQDDVAKALWFIKEELEAEKNSRKRLERLYRKAAQDIIDLKATLARTLQDLEKERRGRELLEVVFDELAREAGDEESVRTDEVICQSAERKAQIQARTELEDKNNGLEKLRIVLKAFLQQRGQLSTQWREVTRERHQ